MQDFRAYRIDQQDGEVVAGFCRLTLDDLSAGDVVVKVSHSTINYKDALAATGKGRILREFPLVGGIDLAGTIVSSACDEFEAGMSVLVNGCGLSETRDGGYAEYARVPADAVVPAQITDTQQSIAEIAAVKTIVADIEPTPVPAHPSDVMAKLVAAYRQKDARSFADLFAEDAITTDARGRSEIFTLYSDFFASQATLRMRLDDIDWEQPDDFIFKGKGDVQIETLSSDDELQVVEATLNFELRTLAGDLLITQMQY